MNTLRLTSLTGGAALLMAVSTTTGYGAFETALEIAQPIVTEESIFVSAVTYVKYIGTDMPGDLVSLVGAESCVIDEMGSSVNRNVAKLMGIRTGVILRPGQEEQYVDTLRVFIDLSAMESGKPPGGWSVEGVVEATVECVLTTAYNSRWGWDPKTEERLPARHVQLEVRGSEEYAHYGGVFAFGTLGALPRKRGFDVTPSNRSDANLRNRTIGGQEDGKAEASHPRAGHREAARG